MKLWKLSGLIFPLVLGGCSYLYDLKAVVINGRLAFIVDPKSARGVSCFNQIDVIALDDRVRAKPATGDNEARVGYGTFWHERVDYECVDEFPIFYGQQLKGRPAPQGQGPDAVVAKPLRIGVIYEVTTTTGAIRYGKGAFKILANRRVVNVERPPLTEAVDQMEPVSENES